MSYPVRYSTRAYQEYEEILDYVSGQFGAAIAARVDIYFEEVIDQIAINPQQFPYSNNKEKPSPLRDQPTNNTVLPVQRRVCGAGHLQGQPDGSEGPEPVRVFCWPLPHAPSFTPLRPGFSQGQSDKGHARSVFNIMTFMSAPSALNRET